MACRPHHEEQTEATRTIRFGLDGQAYQVYVCDRCAQQLRGTLSPFITRACRQAQAQPGLGTSLPPAPRRLVGAALRRYRENLGLGLQGAARILDCHPSKISRIETGQRGIRPKELRELLTEYGIAAAEQDALAAIARPAADAWWRPYVGVLPGPFTEYLQLEAAAAHIQVYEPHLVPELLQTPGYTTDLDSAELSDPAAPPSAAMAAVTLARQHAIVHERQPELTIVIGEAALRHMPGTAIGRAQLHRLAAVAEGKPGITVQVLASSSGVRSADADTPVTILLLAGAPDLGAVHLPRAGRGGVCLVSPADLAGYAISFLRLAASALTPAESARLLRKLAGK